MKTILRALSLALLVCLIVSAQTATTTPTTTPPATATPTVPYTYFAETGITYDYYGQVPASTSGFGVRIGTSNVFSVTDVDTTVALSGAPATPTQYATLRTGLEYHLAVSGRWEFIGLGAVGVTSTGTSTQASFAGGVGLSYDIGSLLTKGKFSLPLVVQYRINAITATEVKPVYGILFRKTF